MNSTNFFRISIVVPIGGANPSCEHIRRWLPSVDFTKFQIIIVQDSLDESVALELQELTSALAHIQKDSLIVETVTHKNVGKSRNAGMRLASGDWIAFWDSDDIPALPLFSEMLDGAETLKADLVVGQFSEKNENGEVILMSGINSIPDLIADPGIWRMAFRRSAIEGIQFPNYSMGEDQVFLYKALQNVGHIQWSDFCVYTYRVGNPNQITNQRAKLSELELAIRDTLRLEARGNLTKTSILQACLNMTLTLIFGGTRHQRFKGFSILLVILGRERCFRLLSKIIRSKVNSRRAKHRHSLVISLAGGLGNQLFQYAAALSYNSKSRIFFESQYGGPRKNNDGLPEIFSFQKQWILIDDAKPIAWFPQKIYNFLIRASGMRENRRFSKLIWPLKLLFSFILLLRFSRWMNISLSKGLGGKTNPPPSRDTYQIGLFQNSENCLRSEVLSSLKLLRLTNPSSELANWIARAKGRKILVVHVRLGDYLLEPDFGVPAPQYYFEAICRIRDLNDFTDIWVFSNDLEEAKKHLSFLNFSYVTWVPEIGNSASETLELMREGSAFVIANSTFSWWGALLSKTEGAQVIAPKPWFFRATLPDGIIPTDWETINPWKSQFDDSHNFFDLHKLGKFGSTNIRGKNVS